MDQLNLWALIANAFIALANLILALVAWSQFKLARDLTGLTTLTGYLDRVVVVVAPIRPVHKSPWLTVAESWLPIAISSVKFAVPRTI